jgi:hypothetical protein
MITGIGTEGTWQHSSTYDSMATMATSDKWQEWYQWDWYKLVKWELQIFYISSWEAQNNEQTNVRTRIYGGTAWEFAVWLHCAGAVHRRTMY